MRSLVLLIFSVFLLGGCGVSRQPQTQAKKAISNLPPAEVEKEEEANQERPQNPPPTIPQVEAEKPEWIFPEFTPSDYQHPQFLKSVLIKVGFGEEVGEKQVDLMACSSGTVKVVSDFESETCQDFEIDRGFHQRIFPALASCLGAPEKSILVKNWGVYQYRKTAKGRWSAHSEALAIDVPAFKIDEQVLNFREATKELHELYGTFAKTWEPEKSHFTESELQSLNEAFLESLEYQKSVFETLWQPLLNCLNEKGIGFIAGKLPPLIEREDPETGETVFERELQELTKSQITVKHYDHLHLGDK